jgi:hypothetical protein
MDLGDIIIGCVVKYVMKCHIPNMIDKVVT